jgi:hypothetical protein
MANTAGVVRQASGLEAVGKGIRGSASVTDGWFGDPVRLMGELSCGVNERGREGQAA